MKGNQSGFLQKENIELWDANAKICQTLALKKSLNAFKR